MRWTWISAALVGLPLLLALGCGGAHCSPACREGLLCVEDARRQMVCGDPALVCGGIAGRVCPDGYRECALSGCGGATDCQGLCVP